MENIKNYDAFKNVSNESPEVNESFWTSIFGKPTVDGAAHDARRGEGWSHTGRDSRDNKTWLEDNYIVFDGQKFYPDQIEYDDYQSTKKIPRVENGKLIVANPAWNL
jgi:hypothetical protein